MTQKADRAEATRTEPMFSVVTCCYNQASFLGENIESVLQQDYPKFEHIVVDDGSTDDTREVCAAYPHVRYIYQDNAGQSAALNRGFQEARGDIIAWVNSDDYYAPGAFARVARELDPARQRWIVAGAADVVDAEGRFMWRLRNGRVSFFRLLFHPRLYPLNGWTVMPCQPSVFFHRTVLDRLGMLDTTLKYGMDYEYWLRALVNGFSFHYVPQVFSMYRYHDTSHTQELGYDTFLPEWTEICLRYYGQLPAWKQFLAEVWWMYARAESFFVRQHKAARDHVAERFGPDAKVHPLSDRLAVVLRATLVAPWYPLVLGWHAIRPQAHVRSTEQDGRV